MNSIAQSLAKIALALGFKVSIHSDLSYSIEDGWLVAKPNGTRRMEIVW